MPLARGDDRSLLQPGFRLPCEVVVQSGCDQLLQFRTGLLVFAELFQGPRQQPARLRLEVSADGQLHRALEVASRVSRLLAQHQDFPSPEEGVSLRLVRRKLLLPLLYQVESGAEVAAG